MPPSRPTRRRSDPNAGPTIVDERSENTAPAPRRRGRRLPPAEGRTVRVTVDLPSADRRGLGRVADLLGDELDVHVPAGQLMAALAHLIADDDQTRLRNAVSEYLRDRVTTEPRRSVGA